MSRTEVNRGVDVSPSAEASSQENVVTTQRFTALQSELAMRSRMQTAVAELGQAALTEVDSELLTAQACGLLVDTLELEFARALEYFPEQHRLVTRAAVGSRRDIKGSEAIDSESLFAFHSDEAVVFDHLPSETRFDGRPLLTELSILSGVSVKLRGRHEAFGVLGAYSTRPRLFREFEVEFVQSVANVLAAAIERKRTTEELDETRAQIAKRERLAAIGSWAWSRGKREWNWSPEVFRLLDVDPEDVSTEYATFLGRVHQEDRSAFATLIERAFATSGEHSLEHRLLRHDGSSRFVRTVVQGVFGGDKKPLRIIGTTQDITEVTVGLREKVRLAAMIELAAHEWRMTCDALDAVLLVIDRSGTILRLNEKGRQVLGLQFENAIGASLPMAGEPWSTIRQLATVVGETHLASNASASDQTSKRQWQISARALTNQELDDERIVIVAHDVTDAVATEKVRRETEVLDSITNFITALGSRAETSLAALTDVLSASIGEIHLSADQLRKARAATYDLSRLFRNLEEYARPFSLDMVPANVLDLLENAIGTVAPLAVAQRVGIEAELEEVPDIVMNAPRLSQLFSGILKLFIDRSESNDVLDVTLESEQMKHGSWVNVTIASTRPLFTRAELDWIIDPQLPRLDDDHAARLSIDHRIVEEHGGNMLLVNRADRSGAFASFRFPVFPRR